MCERCEKAVNEFDAEDRSGRLDVAPSTCPHCGKTLDESFRYCPYCGKPSSS
jgi:predicted amidophosphoribosyltransferase